MTSLRNGARTPVAPASRGSTDAVGGVACVPPLPFSFTQWRWSSLVGLHHCLGAPTRSHHRHLRRSHRGSATLFRCPTSTARITTRVPAKKSFEAQVVSYGGPCTTECDGFDGAHWVYRGDNGFKPRYLTHLEEALKTSCLASKIKARPHIKSCIKTLKRDWFIVNDMIHGVNHSSSGFGFNSTSNMVVAEDDVWDDYLAKYQDAKQWHSKSFIHYEKCCIIFGNDRATGEYAFDVVDAVEELGGNNESNSENGSDPIAPEYVEFTQETSRSQSVTSEVTSNPNKRKKRTSDGGVADMITAAQILGSELSKASNDISAAINANRDMRHLVVAAMEKVLEILEVDKTMYNAKIMGRRKLI
ncbi:hypothetical protein Sjap_015187 [Stephania japonica]|uniref:Myb/SANT-like domain-containing protein n=1 Tax=Stephania japonica TaxID=461633 RepID=A0AAP0IJ42_9MAGN